MDGVDGASGNVLAIQGSVGEAVTWTSTTSIEVGLFQVYEPGATSRNLLNNSPVMVAFPEMAP